MRNHSMILAVVFAMSVPAFAATDHQGVPGTGTLGAPDLVGPSITVSAEQLESGKMVDFYCQITSFGVGTSGDNWTCAGGPLSVDGVQVSQVVSGEMSMSCYIQSRYKPKVCLYTFSGMTLRGPISVTAKGDAYIGTVTFFDGVW